MYIYIKKTTTKNPTPPTIIVTFTWKSQNLLQCNLSTVVLIYQVINNCINTSLSHKKILLLPFHQQQLNCIKNGIRNIHHYLSLQHYVTIIGFWHWYGMTCQMSTCSAWGLEEAQHKYVHLSRWTSCYRKYFMLEKARSVVECTNPVTVDNGSLLHPSYNLLLCFHENTPSAYQNRIKTMGAICELSQQQL